MSSFRLSPAAQRDLSQIWDLTEERWGIRQAEADLEDLRDAIERIAADPTRGGTCDDIRKGYRCHGGSHLGYYVDRADGIGGVDVILILHQRMDPFRDR